MTGFFFEQWVYGFEESCEHLKSRGYTPEWAEAITGTSRKTIIELADKFARPQFNKEVQRLG